MWRGFKSKGNSEKSPASSSGSVYAPQQHIDDIEDCYFYHATELPGHGLIEGEWDLREGVDEYIGHVPLSGQRVLEVGTASGFLCFAMEQRGAEMVAYDLSDEYDWDIVPFGGRIEQDLRQDRKKRIRQLNHAWWLSHQLLHSKARVCYGTAYTIPEAIGPVDIATFGCILLHLRDPFLALQRAAVLAKKSIIVTDVMPGWGDPENKLPMTFIPDPAQPQMNDSWWYLSPDQVSRFLQVLGYPNTTITYHQQPFKDGKIPLYTVVGSVE